MESDVPHYFVLTRCYVRGTKGLWWHQLSAHGVDYSSATTESANAGNALAIVPFGEAGAASSADVILAGRPTSGSTQLEPGVGEDRDGTLPSDTRIDAFDMVKSGHLAEFIRLVEVRLCFCVAILPSPCNKTFQHGSPVILPPFSRGEEERSFSPEDRLDRNGASALHWAAGCGRLDFASYLVEHCHCCPNQRQRGKRSFMGRTPLHW